LLSGEGGKSSRCVEGYRNFALQSPSFATGGVGVLNGIERWAYYTTFTGHWAVGRFALDYSAKDGSSNFFSLDGVCRLGWS
jgi:hypothetical protein